TNTGKTHLAIERLVAHSSGVIGLPLRLLAREVYTRVVEKVGEQSVALITGEEKITPRHARYSVCTVEAMPRDPDVSFVAIDEVQLAADLERGHIFTDRILNVRGRDETLLLGAGTAAPILRQLLPGISIISRPRMSHLAYAGSSKLTRLPRRSAVVAFSANEVYAIAELIRRQRGGAAVVMGALSPRTRNAQVELYQSGDVDYLVATDAIGMGLNLDVDHVAFAQIRKFDGYTYRDLTPPEMGQIAGRAGRHIRDGTFGTSGHAGPLPDEIVVQIESHDFKPVSTLQWRNRVLHFDSLDALKTSLDTVPSTPGLTRALPAVDQRALEFLARDNDVVARCQTAMNVELLWETCMLPDYRKIAPAQHADIISQLFFDLTGTGHVDEDYMAEQVRRADRTDGEIDTLSHRIAQIRTWTYVANQPKWLADPHHWREKTRSIENKLSDALHERLTKRFVDRRTSVLMKRLKENKTMTAEISETGDVTVEGHHVGKLEGFRFTPDREASGEDAKAVKAAAAKALATAFEQRADKLAQCANGDLALGTDGMVRWLGGPVASLATDEDWLKPRAILLADEQLTGAHLEKVQTRIDRFLSFHIETHLKPLTDLQKADELSGIARGIAFRLIENHGIVQRRDIAADVKSLDQDGRAALRRYGVRFGFYHIFVPALIKPAPAELITMLWGLKNDGRDKAGYGDVVHLLSTGRTSLITDQGYEEAFFKLAGYRHLGPRAVRVDILERLADLIRPALYWKQGSEALPDGAWGDSKFIVTPAMMSILGATAEDMEAVLKALGYRHETIEHRAAENHLAGLRKSHGPKPEEKAEPKPQTEEQAAPAEPDASGSAAPESSDDQSATPAENAQEQAAQEPVAEAETVTDTQQEPTEEPKPVLVWRQGRPEHRNRPQHKRAGQGHQQPRDGEKGRGPRKGGGKFKPNRENRQQDGNATRALKPPREKQIDPDSPFAKLQALKQKL
ncbi:MAG: helicase-related protein, partial [Pseudomonadota bacterium]